MPPPALCLCGSRVGGVNTPQHRVGQRRWARPNQDGGLSEGNTVNVGSAGQAAEDNVVPSGMRAATTSPVNTSNPNEEPPRCSTCLIFGHSVDDCPKALKRVVNRVDKDKGVSSEADDDGFIEVKKKKSDDNNGGSKNFNSVSV
nr:hypothetical protein [Tanacetum cinerariifolium]